MSILIKWFSVAVAILLSSYLIPGVVVAGLWTALILAVVIGLINLIVRPIILIVTLPINVVTLGLFTFVINALLIMLASSIVKGFEVGGFLNALIFSIVVSLVSSFFAYIFNK